MKGRYAGCRMTIYGSILPGAASIARSAVLEEHLTERAKYKLKVIDWHRKNGENISRTARHFGYTRKVIRRWIKQYNQKGLLGLNEKSKRPKKTRVPAITPDVVVKIVKLRKQYPAWGKEKIAALLNKEGITISASTVGRVLKRRGLIDKKKSAKRRKAALHPKARFPYGFKVSSPGDMIQIDTKYIILSGGRKLYQFTAIDVLAKYRVLRVYPSLSSRNGRLFLEECLKEFPFSIKAVQTDNGSEFLKEFDKRCKELNIPHYFIYPRHAKQNSYVEISHGADEREFYPFGNVYQDRETMNQKLIEWQTIWNTIRPHQALNQRTPIEYLDYLTNNNLPTKNVIILQS